MTKFITIALTLSTGCIDGNMTQIVGDGTVYVSSCSADMEPKGNEYFALCTPPTCIDGYTSAAINHNIVALDPGKRVIGMAQRPCIQTASDLSKLANRTTTVAP